VKMAGSPDPPKAPADGGSSELAEWHANEAERLLKGRWISSYLKGQLHATLALYYSARQRGGGA